VATVLLFFFYIKENHPRMDSRLMTQLAKDKTYSEDGHCERFSRNPGLARIDRLSTREM
jgi:hypothetical protein